MAKSTVLLGKGDLAIRAAEWLLASPAHDLTHVVPVIPEPGWTGSLAGWAAANGVPTIPSGDYRDLDPSGVDLAISVFYDRIIKKDFIDGCGRIINLHNGPLPRYRGVSPINWALKNGETMNGVTIHEITPGVDDGPIVSQVLFSIYPETDEVADVYGRAVEFGWTLFEQTMPMLDGIDATPQRHEDALSYTRADDPALGERRNFTRATSA